MRTRLRIILWEQWKGITGRARNLMRMGVVKSRAYRLANTRKGYCRTANSSTLLTTLDKQFFAGLGLDGIANYYYWKTTHQRSYSNKPLYTERYVRCEKTGGKLIPCFLLDWVGMGIYCAPKLTGDHMFQICYWKKFNCYCS
jgi:hypothetical protein